MTLTPGSTNTFIALDPPTMTLTHTFVGDDASTYASKAYTIQELDQLTGLTTDANGAVTFAVPVTLETATVVFTDTGESWALSIGLLDPINTLSGIFQRLQHLGYLDAEIEFDDVDSPNNLNALRSGLLLLKASQATGGDAAPDSGSASGSSDDSTTARTGTDADPSCSQGDTPGLDGGIADDGTLDAETSALLLRAYGC